MPPNPGMGPTLFDDLDAPAPVPREDDLDAKIAAIGASGRGMAAAETAEARQRKIIDLRGEDLAAEQLGRIARGIVEAVPVPEEAASVPMPQELKDLKARLRSGRPLPDNNRNASLVYQRHLDSKPDQRRK